LDYRTESNDKTPLFILIRLLKCENIGDLLFVSKQITSKRSYYKQDALRSCTTIRDI